MLNSPQTEQLRATMSALDRKYRTALATRYGAGWTDGGCLTFAVALAMAAPDNCSIGLARYEKRCLHAFVITADGSCIDGDGIYSPEEMRARAGLIAGLAAEQVRIETTTAAKCMNSVPLFWRILLTGAS